MSKLRDCADKLRQLVLAAETNDTAYQQALLMLKSLDSNPDVDLSGMGLKLVFDDGTEVPVPLGGDTELLHSVAGSAVAFLGEDGVRIWEEIYKVATEANNHCQAAVRHALQRAEQQQQTHLAPPDGPAVPPSSPLPPPGLHSTPPGWPSTRNHPQQPLQTTDVSHHNR